MATKSVITIGRQYGSGGRYVGRLLAEKLGIPFYDKELLTETAKLSGICEEVLESHDENTSHSMLFSFLTGSQMRGDLSTAYMEMPLNHRIFLAQFDAIRQLAAKGPCVIVGRCGDYVLHDAPNAVHFFIRGSMPSRIERAVKYYGIEKDKAEDVIRKADKRRASYYNYYATGNWGDANNYDMCIDTGTVGVEGAVEVMARYIELHESSRKDG